MTEYCRRVKTIVGWRARATNGWAVPVLRYFFGVMRWYRTDLIRLDRATRRILRNQGAHQYTSAIERVNLSRYIEHYKRGRRR